ncbi:phosphonate metabolism transcriptional regulator PhnF [Bacillus horti]|uniref:Phosphonate metabolism transcriptional regulator PhnF n=1 Tax=Caldalkalibacillus horti TaxID=77523 RepID=A0ABT9W1C0_9BACI|nr:phosphonate metabolism transcriptional regulator PhnF [Bacillus horti]MDQ0167037.1 phosphonate metabolism transcriptional regulator PhnF [Bacillus horti]
MKTQDDGVLHLEIAEYLIKQIRQGVFSENQKIPSENDLCRQFQVNRHVVRQAIARMTNLGWVTPVQGRGCYVNQLVEPIQYVLSSQTRFSENMESQGLPYTAKLLSWEEGIAGDEERANLELAEGARVYRLEIMRSTDDNPLSVTSTVLPKEEFPDLETHLTNFSSLYRIFIEQYRFRPIRKKSIVQACLPLLKDAKLLDIPESVPIVQIESLMNHPGGAPIEYSVARIRGDRHKYMIEF